MIDLAVGLVLGVRMGADTSDASRTDSEASYSVMAVKVIVVRRGVGRCVLHVDWILCGRVDGWMDGRVALEACDWNSRSDLT